MPKNIFIIAGEASGDLHGSNLVLALKGLSPDMEFSGMGGPLMVKAGVRSFQDISELSVIGLGEVLSSLEKFKAAFRMLVEKLEEEKPCCVILIDYPEFNLRFAREAKGRGIPVIYYISPQIWAWRRGRVKTIKRFVDKMIVILGFEKDFYAKYGVSAEFVGNPLLDSVRTLCPRDEFLKRHGMDISKKTVVILPGSRRTEVSRNLPLMSGAAEMIREKLGDGVQFMVAKFGGEFNIYDCMNAADVVLVASGTATIEAAILEKPMIIVYQVSFLTWVFGKLLIRIPHIGLVNIVAGEKVVPEFVGFRVDPRKIAGEAVSILLSPSRSKAIKTRLAAIKGKLGMPGASKRAAEIIKNSIRL